MINNLKGAQPSRVISDLRDLFSTNAQRFGDKVAYYFFDASHHQQTWSYRQLYDNMTYIGTALTKLGLKGKRVAISGDQHPGWFSTFVAVINGGGVSVPIDKDLHTDQLVNFVNWSEAEAMVYTSCFNGKMPALADQMPRVKHLIAIDPSPEDLADPRVIAFADLLAMGKAALEAGEREYLEHRIDMDRMCALLFTSGTTGTSKGVMLSHRNFTFATNASCQSMSYDSNNNFVSILPPFHTYEITCGQFAILNLGASILINDSLKNILRNFKTFRPNALMLVPRVVELMYKRVWDEIRRRGMEKKVRLAMAINRPLLACGIDIRKKLFGQITDAFGGQLKSIVCGGAPISPQIIKDFYAFGITVLEGYGITECSPLVAVNSPGKVRFHSVGKPVVGCRVKIDKAPQEETGEILVQGDNVMLGYYQNPEATQEVFTQDGWFRTGDIGYMDKDGYVFITGRKKNIILLSNGKNVFPEELEEYLAAYHQISESVVVAAPNAVGTTVLTAIIVPAQELLDQSDEWLHQHFSQLVDQLNKTLPAYKQILSVKIRREEFEKNSSKKIMRYKIQY